MPPDAEARWGRPFRIAAPFTLDVLAPQVAFGSSGAAAVGFAVQDADNPTNSIGYVVWRGAGGTLSRVRQVPSAQQVLALAFDGSAVALLTGSSRAGDPCCGAAAVVRMNRGGAFTGPRILVRALSGATAGQLVPIRHGLTAVVGTERGLWAAQASRGGRFGRTHRLTSEDARPEAIAAAAGASGGAMIAWAQRDRGNPVPGTIYLASGTARSAPSRRRPVITVGAGRRIDEVALAGNTAGRGPSLAWIDSWYDRRGVYHSRVEIADLALPKQVRSFAVLGQIAAGLSFAQDPRGDQLLSWKTCTRAGACTVRAAVRRPGRSFDGPRRLGSIEAGQSPSAALSRNGEGLIAWVHQGHVLAAALAPHRTRFGGAHTVSGTNYAADLTLAFGPGRTALAVWSQGTLAPEVVGSVFG